MLYTAKFLEQKIHLLLKPYALTQPQYNVLRILRGQHPNGITINDIISRMMDKMSNVSRLVDKLHQKELLRRDTDPHDRRAVNCSITDRGLEILKLIDESVNQLDIVLDRIELSAIENLNDTLDEIRTLISENEPTDDQSADD